MMCRRGVSSVVVALGLSIAAGGCSTGSDFSTRQAASDGLPVPSSGAPRVVMQNLFFDPNAVGARVGEHVTWLNKDSSPHNVIFISGPRFASSDVLRPGQSFSILVTQPGTIHYYCSLHPWMKATVVVKP